MRIDTPSRRGWLLAAAIQLLATCAVASPSWRINPDGTGSEGSIPVTQVAVGGVGFVQIIPSAESPYDFQFIEHGAYQLLQPGSNTPFTGHDLTVSYSVFGSGSFLNPLALHFTSGSISLYSDASYDFATSADHYGVDNGTLVARFGVFDGGVAASGLVTVLAALESDSVFPGYLFTDGGIDLASGGGASMALGVFNQTADPDALLVAGVVCGLAGYTGPGCNPGDAAFANSPLAFTVSDGGFANLIADIPEPGTPFLLFAGLAALAASAGIRRPRQDNPEIVSRTA